MSLLQRNQGDTDMNRDSKQWVIDAMTSCLPEDCPLPFSEVISAKFTGKQTVQAQVKLFDGPLGVLEVTQTLLGKIFVGWNLSRESLLGGNALIQEKHEDIPTSWSMQWLQLPGGPINWNGTCWERAKVLVVLG